jgi:hypothetical protein
LARRHAAFGRHRVPRFRREESPMVKLTFALAALAAALVAAVPATAATVAYQATYVEPVGGPNQSPFSCPPGTSCGSASISGIGHSDNQIVNFIPPMIVSLISRNCGLPSCLGKPM